METPLPPVPPDLWPTIPPTRSQRALHKAFSVEMSSASAKPLLHSLSRSIHEDMGGAGIWAAKIGTDTVMKELLSPQAISRQCAHDAAQLLSIYTAVYNVTDSPGPEHLTPDALKASATKNYQVGFRQEREEQLKMGVSFNDNLYSQVKGRPMGGGPGLSR